MLSTLSTLSTFCSTPALLRMIQAQRGVESHDNEHTAEDNEDNEDFTQTPSTKIVYTPELCKNPQDGALKWPDLHYEHKVPMSNRESKIKTITKASRSFIHKGGKPNVSTGNVSEYTLWDDKGAVKPFEPIDRRSYARLFECSSSVAQQQYSLPASSGACLFLLGVWPSVVSAERLLPLPSGPYDVLYNTFAINDASRIDPLDPNNGTRRLMLSSFYPVERSACSQTCTVPYISRNAAPYIFATGTQLGISSDELGAIALQVCCKTTGAGNSNASEVPLVVLMHGLGGTRLLHNALAQELASAGFAVVTMDHTFESIAVEFPDGSVIPGINDTTNAGPLEPLHDIRIADVRFAVSQLKRREVAAKVAPGVSCRFSTKRIVALGHSFGGSVSINLLMLDSRFVGGLNLDGNQHGNITDTHQPAVLVGAAGVTPYPHNSTTDPTWAETLRHLKGWKAEIGVTDIAHMGFSDLAYLSGIGALTLSKEVADPLIGSLNGKRSFDIVSTYVKEFLDFVFYGKNTTLFDKPSQEFPEVIVV
ncbi:hypothetical protein P171DRAFT_470780 [Karstenula rhodostoma CBS 690.94]|uniref:1-alkyl-2-acetylglycerophosphocholine esterase n=1 Tax=Karstenula rhodostoma CBS 690.94 TaxID=1392251 RepID=A0A9P4PP05_9PLEO|nr:hypothetical protein P171DRAFT_470780 [Karstenula rhodostoma CBS 690.94]